MNTIRVLCIFMTVLCINVIAIFSKSEFHLKPIFSNIEVWYLTPPIISAIQKNDKFQVEKLVKSGVNINRTDEVDGLAPLHLSAGAGLEKITQILIDNGADVDVRNAKGKTPLEIAAVNGQPIVVEQLCKAGANVDNINNDNYSILKAAIEALPADRLKLRTNPFLNDTKIDFNDQEKCCLLLINYGANVNGTNNGTKEDDWTPLHIALWSGYDRIGESLINAGADINAARHRYTWYPFRRELIKPCAFRCYRHYPITEFMIKNGADVNAPVRGSVPYTPFHLAIKHEEDPNIIKLMIENGADINKRISMVGEFPLQLAVHYARVPVVELLINAGAIVNATAYGLNTPLHFIGMYERMKARNSDEDEDEDDYWRDNYDDDCYKIAELLIKNGADLNAKNDDGKTPLDVVTNERIRELFREKMASTSSRLR